jgi:putative tryptophan/tyrosine transport system substrate-binding protein
LRSWPFGPGERAAIQIQAGDDVVRMRRRDFTMGMLLAAAARTGRAQEAAKQHRIAIVISTGPVARVHDPTSHAFQAFWQELHRLGDAEGQNLIVDLYSGEGRPAGFADLARKVVKENPEVIVAIAGPITSAISAATDTIPIVASGTYTASGVAPSLARPGGNMTGVRVEEPEIWGKRLQILKEAVPSASKIAYLDIRTSSESAFGRQVWRNFARRGHLRGGNGLRPAGRRKLHPTRRAAGSGLMRPAPAVGSRP